VEDRLVTNFQLTAKKKQFGEKALPACSLKSLIVM
jgi:hypothetical protein